MRRKMLGYGGKVMRRPDVFEEGLATEINEDNLWGRLAYVARLFLLGVATFAKSAALLRELKKRGLLKIDTGPLNLPSGDPSAAGGPGTVGEKYVKIAQLYGDTVGRKIGERIGSLPVQPNTGTLPDSPVQPTPDEDR